MKVRDLISELNQYDEDAEVYIMMQENYPFECNLDRTITREELTRRQFDNELPDDEDEEEDPDVDAKRLEWAMNPWRDRWSAQDYELPPEDVFLVEGSQRRYGSKHAWDG